MIYSFDKQFAIVGAWRGHMTCSVGRIVNFLQHVACWQEALQQQVQRVQELRTKLQESEDRCSVLQDLADSRSAEAADAKQQCDTLLAKLEAQTVELNAAAVQV